MSEKIYPIAIVLAFFLISTTAPRAAVFVVDRSDDASVSVCSAAANDCTLRGAITASNNGSDASNTINFSIPGSGVHTINILSPLPGLARSVTINGASQSGYFGKPLIELNGSGAGSQTDGISIVGLILGQIAPTTTYSIYGLAINRFGGDGISLDCTGTGLCNLNLLGNFVGTDPTGLTALPNSGSGISLSLKGSSSYHIGGTGIFEGNVVSGNNSYGIHITAPNDFGIFATPAEVTIEGNKVGTDYDGTAAVGNFYGVYTDNVLAGNHIDLNIGGTTAGARNLISGNARSGIYIYGGSDMIAAVIAGNYIGTNVAGTAGLGNATNGIETIGAFGLTVGGTTNGAGNVISGNNADGINVFATPAAIRGNRIGTNDAGTAAIGNTQNGVHFYKTNGGGVGSLTAGDPAGGNLISGNGADGVNLEESAAVKVFGNVVGLNAAGTSKIQNLGDGLEVKNVDLAHPNNGTHQIRANIVSGNLGDGILINGTDALSNIVTGNIVGTNSGGSNLGNNGSGIHIALAASQNQIGGTDAGDANVIAFNAVRGIAVDSGTKNALRRNSVYSNGLLGIDLGANGVTPNDVNDADTGADNLQNFPVITLAEPDQVIGTLNSTANTAFSVDLYRVDSCDASGNGEGRYFLGSTDVATPPGGNIAAFAISAPSLTAGQIVTATATDANGNTSEFSPCKTVTPPVGNVTFSAASYSANEGGGQRTIVVSRTGGSFGAIQVGYATSDGSAAAGSDYTAVSGTLQFADGEVLKSFNVSVLEDSLDEPDETVNLTLSNPSPGVSLAPNPTAVLTIVDNDDPPALSISDVSSSEGNLGTVQFNFGVTLSSPSGYPVSVGYSTANGTATASSDYVGATGTLNFAPGETQKTITVTVVGDLTPELDETFFVNLSNPSNASVSDGQGLGTILDDDSPGRLSFAFAPYSGVEGDNVTITVARTAGTAGTVAVDYSTTGGTALPGSDYVAAAGTLVFLDGETSKTFNVRLLDDAVPEPAESVGLALSNPIGGATLGVPSSAVLNIADNDNGTLLTLSGVVSLADATPLGNITMTLQGTQNATVQTDAQGHFAFADLAPNGTYSVTPSAIGYTFNPVSRQFPNLTADDPNVNFTATPAPSRQLRVIGGNATPGQNVPATVELVAQGDENSLGFSLNYDQSILVGPQVALDADAAGAFLTLNTSVPGKLGILIALPAGQVFNAGTRSLVTITFATLPTNAYGTPLTFGDVPLAREIANVNADGLPTSYLDGTVTFAQGFEADVAPRPTGNNNGTISITDFTQVGRFVAGLDTLNSSYNEFQRADCAPRASLGNGTLSVADYTQAGRYAAGLDIVTPTGGLAAPNLFDSDGSGKVIAGELARSDLAPTATRVVDTQSSPGQQVTVSIEADAQGTENGFGFTLSYDPLTLSNPVPAKGSDTQAATLIPNLSTPGKVGIVLAMPFGQAVAPGTRQIVTVTFTVAANAAAGITALTFGDAPVIREVSDINANVLGSSFADGGINILGPTAAGVTVGGRAVDNLGNGLPLVRLELSDPVGRIRTAMTNPFGYFEFTGVGAGGIYVLSASNKRYVFIDAVRVLNVESGIGDLEFVGMDSGNFGR